MIFIVVASMFSVAVAVAGLLAALFKRGINEGRLTEILSNLQSIVHDHEMRLRELEKR